MIDQKVIDYIRAETTKGVPKGEIIKNLMQSGGWSHDDIESHFLFLDPPASPQQVGTISQSNTVASPVLPSGKRILWINFLIFILYYCIGYIPLLLKINDLAGTSFGLLFGGYIVHAGILILLSLINAIQAIWSKSQSQKAYAKYYFLTAVLLLIIGFGACTFGFISSGALNGL